MINEKIIVELKQISYFQLTNNETFESLTAAQKINYVCKHRFIAFSSSIFVIILILSTFFFFKQHGINEGLEKIGLFEGFDKNQATQVLVASINSEFEVNQPATIEKYNMGTFKVIGIYHSTDVDSADSAKDFIVLSDGQTGSPLYARLGKKYKIGIEDSTKRGQLVQLICKDFGIFGTGPVFNDCREMGWYPIPPGMRPEIVYDKLLYENNPLLNGK